MPSDDQPTERPPGEATRRIEFGPFALDRRTGELRDADGPVGLRPLPTRALLLLVERRGELVTREELRHRLWGDTAVEWEAGLHQVIRQVRRCLRDDAGRPAYIETVPRRGYRFTALVRPPTASAASLPGTRRSRWQRGGAFLSGVGATVAFLVVAVLTACLLMAP